MRQQTVARVKASAVIAPEGANTTGDTETMSKYTVRDCTTGHTTTIDIQNRTKEAVGIDITIQARGGDQMAHEWIGIEKIDLFKAMLGTPEAEETE